MKTKKKRSNFVGDYIKLYEHTNNFKIDHKYLKANN